MYIVIMGNDKTLSTSRRINLYEGDNLADKLMFLFPQTYKNIELSECIVRLNYTDLNGEEVSEILVKDEELYKDRLCYRYPIDSKFTEYYRDIIYDISFSVGEDADGDGIEDDVLFHTENHMIRILPRPDSIIHEDPIEKDAAGKIQKEMIELDHRIVALEEKDVDVKDAVKYTEQDLTEEQKKQARKNVGVMSQDDTLDMFDMIARYWAEDIEYVMKNINKVSDSVTLLSNQMISLEIEDSMYVPDEGSMLVEDDGNGNVSILVYDMKINEENGNVSIITEMHVEDDKNGNVTIVK